MHGKLSFVIKSSLVIAAGALMLLAAAAGADDWRTCHNDRYGTTIDYPDFFKPQPASDNDDGRAFKSADGADFWVAASYNTLDFNVARYRDFIMKNLDAGFGRHLSGPRRQLVCHLRNEGRQLFYERHMLSHGAQLTEDFGISYPAALKTTYDPVVARMAKSFRPGTGFQSP